MGGNLSVAGCPESSRDMSASGPFGPSVLGVWQSLHPPTRVRYFPRSAGVWVDAALPSDGAEVADLSAAGWHPEVSTSVTATPRMNRIASPLTYSIFERQARLLRGTRVMKKRV